MIPREEGVPVPDSVWQASRRLQEGRRHRVRVWAALHHQSQILQHRLQSDQASFLRAEMQQAGDPGSAHFAHRISCILRCTASLKHKLCYRLCVYVDVAEEAAGKEAVLFTMGHHYAAAERARFCSVLPRCACLRPCGAARRATDCTAHPIAASSRAGDGWHLLPQSRRPLWTPPQRLLFSTSSCRGGTFLCPLQDTFARCLLQWNGGCAFSIPKGTGKACEVASWRSIMLLEPEGKVVQKAWRPNLLQVTAQRSPPGHHGGFPHNTPSMVSFRVRAHLLALRQQGLSGGALFLNCKAAYYSIRRDLLAIPAGCSFSEEDLQRRATVLFATPEDQRRFVADLQQGNILHRMQADPALRRFVMAQTTDAWFTTDGDGTIIWNTESGAAPCRQSPMSSLRRSTHPFSRTPRHPSSNAGIRKSVPAVLGALPLLYVGRRHQVVSAVVEVAKAAQAGMGRLGLQPNFSAGKTEVLRRPLQGSYKKIA